MIKNIEELETFVMSEQPTTCVVCGARVEEIKVVNLSPRAVTVQCLDEKCKFEFISDSDQDI